MNLEDLKHKLRELKRLEITLRFGSKPENRNIKLVWDRFFSTRDFNISSVKYNLSTLLVMDHEKLKEVFDEYFYEVFFQNYKENSLNLEDMYDPTLLSFLGLPHNASHEDIKKRFRELAKKYHPDCGGDSRKFIELKSIYEKLINHK